MAILVFLDVCLAGIGLYFIKQLLQVKHPLPPGPTGWPLIGNLLDFPSHKPWLTFASFGKIYGEISSMKVLGTNMIILNTAQIASDILDKRSAIYSDRPHFTMASELSGWGNLFVLLQNGDRFRQYRKLFHRHIGSKNSLAIFHPAIEDETRKFLHNVLKTPEDLAAHIRMLVGATVLNIAYGYGVQEGVDPLVDLADEAMMNFSLLAAPGAFLVDVLPVLRYMPEWLPGTRFLQIAKENRHLAHETITKPYQFVLDQLAAGNASHSFSYKLLEGGVTPEEEDVIKWAAISMYLAGSDTTVSTLYSFFLAMTIYPDIQKRAQAELDSVIGAERLPTFEDRESLPYINAVCTELLRWHPVAPLGITHVCTQDDVYQGFLIPKGSYIIPNIWQILHEETTYPDPDTFNPERYLGDHTQPDPRNAFFGYGRRICPGLHIVDASVFTAVSRSLAVLDISRVIENGVEVIPELDTTDGAVVHPRAFRCKITPRLGGAKKGHN